MKMTKEQMVFALLAALLSTAAGAQTNSPGDARPELMYVGRGNYSNQLERALRYTPIGTDFVITNGTEFFNRPLYGPNNSFRADAGDKPELSLYLPGRGGNLRLGVKTTAGITWLSDASNIVARYRPGSMFYDIKDPVFMDARELHLKVLPLAEGRGVIVRADLNSAWMNCELVWAFGGANGMKGRRNGDIGCEREPVSQFFQLKPEQCAGSQFSIASNTFVLKTKTAMIAGVVAAAMEVVNPPAEHHLADAKNWDVLPNLLKPDAGSNSTPVVVGRIELVHEMPVYIVLQQLGEGEHPVRPEDLSKVFAAAEERQRAIAERVVVETPDEFVNAAAAALNVAADAIWDEKQQSFMHGAVAWRSRLLGWRGQYAGDALGWHERTAAHFAGYARNQNTEPIPEKIPPADEDSNLARNETALHSNGDMMNRSHYDMNLVAVDSFFRHLLWTGDTNFARAMWPVIQRHLAWEKRLFRREFGPEKLPLYEAYAAIWASDDVQYSGGGSAHGSAYNHWHNKMAARVAKILGEDGTPYEREAELIRRGMEKYLWLPDKGTFAEFKDLLGLQFTHDSPALWTFYHTLDSEVPTPTEAWQMSRWVDENIAHIPIQISNDGTSMSNCFVMPTSNWMPYSWSINNVVVAEMAHTSLAYWQANRPDEAFRLFKGFTLDTMFLGLCPGNVGMTTHYDMARGEAQRDFADGCGAMSRALVEGLFGIRPDALSGELKIVPGYPQAWMNATIRHPNVNYTFRRDAQTETFVVEPRFSGPMSLRLQVQALLSEVASATVNGKPAKFNWLTNSPGASRLEVLADAASRWEISVQWRGAAPINKQVQSGSNRDEIDASPAFDWRASLPAATKLEEVSLTSVFNDKVTQIFRNEYRAPRSPYCSLAMPAQGIGGWCEPKERFDVDDSGLRAVAARNGGSFVLPNGISFQTSGEPDAKNIIFTSQWDNYPQEASVPLAGKARHAYLLMAGSSNPMQSRVDNGEVVVAYADGKSERLTLRNPSNWWPIDQDYFIDDYAFRRSGPIPPRVDLKTGKVRILEVGEFKGKGDKVPGGAATVLDLPLDPDKELKSLTVRALANEVIIGLMAVTLER